MVPRYIYRLLTIRNRRVVTVPLVLKLIPFGSVFPMDGHSPMPRSLGIQDHDTYEH